MIEVIEVTKKIKINKVPIRKYILFLYETESKHDYQYSIANVDNIFKKYKPA